VDVYVFHGGGMEEEELCGKGRKTYTMRWGFGGGGAGGGGGGIRMKNKRVKILGGGLRSPETIDLFFDSIVVFQGVSVLEGSWRTQGRIPFESIPWL
jgi:hypothetical protein